MEFTGDGVVIEKAPSELDKLVVSVTGAFDAVGVDYAVVSGYVAVLFGRARATEDIDVIVEEFDEPTARQLVDRFSLERTVPVRLGEAEIRVGSLELQISYKLGMGTPKHFEDALYLHEVLEGNLKTERLESHVERLGVQEEYDRLRAE